VDPCSRRIPHDWAACPCAHQGERAARRDPRRYNYRGVPCDFAKEVRGPGGSAGPGGG
jgi:hypothetical protein